VVSTLQVEVSTACTSRCIYCPVALYSDWRREFMDFSLFQKTIQEGREVGVEHLHLQGWGEPLLHPRFLDMLKEARRYYKASFTTNGLLLGRVAEDVVKIGVDVVAVTFAGATAETHNRVRVRNDFDTVLQNLKTFVKAAKNASAKTRTVAIYMMLKNTYRELPQFVKLMAEIGVDEVHLSNLDYIPRPDLWGLKVFSKMFEPPPGDVIAAVEAAKKVAKEVGITLFHRLFTPWEHAECPEVPTSTLFIGVDGSVYPCVYLGLSTPSAERCFEERCEKAPRLAFGNLRHERLADITKKKSYREFVHRFEVRKIETIPPEPPEVCKKCYKLYWV